MLVSVIIPVYNVEKYLLRCLQSVSDQTYRDLDIVLIDDGSTDNSGKMCDDFAKEDKRTRVIHKDNGGLSSARNIGMKIAKGEFVIFLDSDDYLAKQYIEKAVSLCKIHNADIVVFAMRYIKEQCNEEAVITQKNMVIELTREMAIKESLYQKHFSCCIPGKLYAKKVLYGIEFPDNKLSEDLAVCHLILNNAGKIVYSSEVGYYYRQQQNSIMHVFNLRRLDALEWTKEIELFCKKNYPSLMKAAYCRSFNVAIHLALDFPDTIEDYQNAYNLIWKEIIRTRGIVIRDRECRFREKVAAMISYLGINVLKKAWNSVFTIKRDAN